MFDNEESQTAQKAIVQFKEHQFFRRVACAKAFGFRLDRINGSHHIFVHADIPELANLQNVKGKAKSYQVRQLLQLIERYNLQMKGE